MLYVCTLLIAIYVFAIVPVTLDFTRIYFVTFYELMHTSSAVTFEFLKRIIDCGWQIGSHQPDRVRASPKLTHMPFKNSVITLTVTCELASISRAAHFHKSRWVCWKVFSSLRFYFGSFGIRYWLIFFTMSLICEQQAHVTACDFGFSLANQVNNALAAQNNVNDHLCNVPISWTRQHHHDYYSDTRAMIRGEFKWENVFCFLLSLARSAKS